MKEREIQSGLRKAWGATSFPFAHGCEIGFESGSQKIIMEQWQRWIEMGVSGIVSGLHGSGKSYALQRVQGSLCEKLYHVVGLTHTSLSATDLLSTLCQKAGIESASRRGQTARLMIEHWKRSHRRPVLLIDEAQNLNAQALEELRLLMCSRHMEDPTHQGLVLALCGDEELLPKLRLHVNASLLSRMGYQMTLEGLQEKEVESYLQAHFQHVGVESFPVESQALTLIYQVSDGCARKMNQLMQHAVVLMLESSQNKIRLEYVQKSVAKVPSIRPSKIKEII
jgi:general secretion pathway protein A